MNNELHSAASNVRESPSVHMTYTLPFFYCFCITTYPVDFGREVQPVDPTTDRSIVPYRGLARLFVSYRTLNCFEQILAVARPVVKWGLMPAVLWMGMRTEPSPGLIDVLYPF